MHQAAQKRGGRLGWKRSLLLLGESTYAVCISPDLPPGPQCFSLNSICHRRVALCVRISPCQESSVNTWSYGTVNHCMGQIHTFCNVTALQPRLSNKQICVTNICILTTDLAKSSCVIVSCPFCKCLSLRQIPFCQYITIWQRQFAIQPPL